MKNLFCITLVLLLGSVAWGQTASITIENAPTASSPTKQVTKVGAVELEKLKRVTVKALDHGVETTFEGVSLGEVMKLGGVEFGEKLRGKRLADYLLVEAADKYRVVFTLAELDPGFTDKMIILADKRDGKPLDAKAGPWQIIVPDEKRAGRWVRQVTSLRVLSAPL